MNAFRVVSDDRLYGYVGRTDVKYIPIGEEVELNLGQDREVLVKPRLMNWEKVDLRFNNQGRVAGWTVKETWEFEIQNSKEIGIVLDIRRNFGGDWEMATKTQHEQVDRNKVKFVQSLAPGEKRTLQYVLTTRHGINERR